MLYVFFFVPIGERTLCDHVKRIARTPEAQDLGRDLGRASIRVAERTREELQEGMNLPALAGDAGPPRYRPDIDDGTPRPTVSAAPRPSARAPVAPSGVPAGLGLMPRAR